MCVGVVLFKLFVPAGAARDADRPSPARETARDAGPRPTARPAAPAPGARPAGPTLNGVPYDNSPYVHKVNLNHPAAPPSPR